MTPEFKASLKYIRHIVSLGTHMDSVSKQKQRLVSGQGVRVSTARPEDPGLISVRNNSWKLSLALT